MNTPIFVQAVGLTNPLSNTLTSISEGLFEGSSNGLHSIPFLESSVLVGSVTTDLPQIPISFSKFNTRVCQLLLDSVLQILPEIQVAISTYGPSRVGIILGTSTSGVLEGGEALSHAVHTGAFPDTYTYKSQEISLLSDFLSEYLGITGPAYCLSTACTSSAKAFAEASRLIQLDLVDAVIVGGADSLCPLTLHGFHSLDSLSPTQPQPFCATRDGIVIGEAAGVFLLDKTDAAVRLYAVSETSDAYHITAPDPSGAGAFLAMQQALQQAQLLPSDIDYINLHGTGTLANDSMEAAAVHRLFGNTTFCSSTKTLTGHTLGAAGITEAGFCYLTLSKTFNPSSFLPPQRFDSDPDLSLPELLFSPLKHTHTCRFVLSNSFAFGGSNCALILGHS